MTKKNRGFTLVELILVTAILGILILSVLSVVSGKYNNEILEKENFKCNVKTCEWEEVKSK